MYQTTNPVIVDLLSTSYKRLILCRFLPSKKIQEFSNAPPRTYPLHFHDAANVRGKIHQGRQTMARRTTVRITTETLLIVGNSGVPRCPVCGGAMVTLGQGRTLCGVTIERLNRWLESGAVHHSDVADLPYLVCLHSLLIRLQNNNPA
jgi:hypothetical protein